jgi:lambda repressor-like predicted transcriptional regulator
MRKDLRLRLWQKSGWTYRRLAVVSGYDHQTLRRAMQGLTRDPSRAVADVLARAVSTDSRVITADELFPPRPTELRAAAAA